MTPESRTGDTRESHRGLSEGVTQGQGRGKGYREVQRGTEEDREGKVKVKDRGAEGQRGGVGGVEGRGG